ncbi:MAG: hypothetical protein R3185_03935 [Candidatus Thermoplasmatota archaeon]|nr:hypothetical protein [Candidatus Thermoplasmatota archaeon]
MSRRACLTVLLLLSLLLSGCTAPEQVVPPEELGGAATPVSAVTALEHAAAWADEHWRTGSEALLVSGIETASSGDPVEGRPGTWQVFLWHPGTNETRTVTVVGDGEEVRGRNASKPTNEPTPLGSWSVDSPEAIQAGRANATFQAAAEAEDGAVAMTLGTRDQGPVWELFARSRSQGLTVWVSVDARTGELLDR